MSNSSLSYARHQADSSSGAVDGLAKDKFGSAHRSGSLSLPALRVLVNFFRRLSRRASLYEALPDEHGMAMRVAVVGDEITITCSCGSHVRLPPR